MRRIYVKGDRVVAVPADMVTRGGECNTDIVPVTAQWVGLEHLLPENGRFPRGARCGCPFTCRTCGCEAVSFTVQTKPQFCSNACLKEHRRQRVAAIRAANAKPRPRAKCQNCNTEYILSRSDSKFCSAKCRVMAHRRRNG